MTASQDKDNLVPWATLAEAMSTGVFGRGGSSDHSGHSNGLLPIVVRGPSGLETLAGSYDPDTGTMWMTRAVQDLLIACIGASEPAVVVLDRRGAGGAVDLHKGTVALSAGLGSSAELDVLRQIESADWVDLGTLEIRSANWAAPSTDSKPPCCEPG
ncbi:MAG: hypothetical protein ACRBN8_01345 [Nannocystales bacterium]